jgi:YVTN family beta-propeller protein
VLDIRLLGPVEVRVGEQVLDIGGPKQRVLLAVLALSANQPVPRQVLIDRQWAGNPPEGAQHALEAQISRLRKALEATVAEPVLMARAGAYVLRVPAESIDVRRFERLATAGRRALAGHAPHEAAADLSAALALWRGEPLADFSQELMARPEVARLDELRLGVIEDRIEADLALGRHADVVAELGALVQAHPYRERLYQLLMVAMYRCGRQHEALAVYQSARRTLVDELGIEPGQALTRTERAILNHDLSLEPPTVTPVATAGNAGQERPAPMARARRARVLVAAGACAVLAAAVLSVLGTRTRAVVAEPDSIAVINAGSGALTADVEGVGQPGGVAYGAGATWVTDAAAGLLIRIGAADQVTDIQVGRGPAGVTVADGEVWVANNLDGTVSEVNAGARLPVKIIRVGIGPSAIASGQGSVWVANTAADTLSRIDAVTGHVVATIPLNIAPTSVAAGAGAVWVTSQQAGRLLRVDPADNRVSQAIPIGQSPAGLAVGAGSVWVADAGGTVWRIDPRTGRSRTIEVSGVPAGVAYSGGALWVAGGLNGSVSRISPASGKVQLIHIGNETADIAAAGGRVWATVLPSLASHRGGTLTVITQLPPDQMPRPPTDPAKAFYTVAFQILGLTNDGLVGYRAATGLAGDQLVPDLATALPKPTDGGTTYTFHLRPGLRYSTGAPVRPEDFRRAFERMFHLRNYVSYYAGIVGAAQCMRRPGHCDIARGIVANDAAGTISFHLTAPDPEFLYQLALSFAYPVPRGTPNHLISAAQLPATGPYMTKSLVPGHTWVLVRNPRFRQWSAQAQPRGYPDRIIMRFDVPPGQAVADVENGTADVLLGPPPGSLGQLQTHYTRQLHTGPMGATIALALNTRLPPFNKLAARQAVNYAINRATVAGLNGGALAAQPTCQILPPTVPGYSPYCPYTILPNSGGVWAAPDLARAQRLVRQSGTRGDRVTVLYGPEGTPFPSLATARYIVSVLDQLGYRTTFRVVKNPSAYWGVLNNSRDRVQAGFVSWYQDYPTPADFVDLLLTCRSFLPDNYGNLNSAEFCNPRIDAQGQRALSLEPGDPVAAGALWAAIDRELTDQAPWVPLYNPPSLTVLSARVGNYQYHPYWNGNLLLDQLWVR